MYGKLSLWNAGLTLSTFSTALQHKLTKTLFHAQAEN
jgi:hypothetical protein